MVSQAASARVIPHWAWSAGRTAVAENHSPMTSSSPAESRSRVRHLS